MKKHLTFSAGVALAAVLFAAGSASAATTAKFIPAKKPWGVCTKPVQLTETYQDAKVPFTMKYPKSWQVDISDEGFALRLLRNTTTSNQAVLVVGPHEVKNSTAEMILRMAETASLNGGHITAVDSVQNRVGIWYWRKQTVDFGDCGDACKKKVLPQYYTLGVGIGDGTTLVHVTADVHTNALKQVFCEAEAIEKSLKFAN